MDFETESKDFALALTLGSYAEFVSDHVRTLRDFEEAIDESPSHMFDPSTSPLGLTSLPSEQAEVVDLIVGDNEVFNKFMTVMGSLCDEMQLLGQEAQDRFYISLLMYGESAVDLKEGDEQTMVGRFMPLLQEVCSFLDQTYAVIESTVQNLAAISMLSNPTGICVSTKDLHLQPVYNQLAQILGKLIVLDEIVARNSVLKDHWAQFKRVFKTARLAPTRFNLDDTSANNLDRLISLLEQQVLEAMMFNTCIERDFNSSGAPTLARNSAFLEGMLSGVRSLHASVDSALGGSPSAIPEGDTKLSVIGLLGLYVLHSNLSGSADRKMLKALWDLQKKAPVICAAGHVIFFPGEFLVRQVPDISKVVDRRTDWKDLANAHLTQLVTALPTETKTLEGTTSLWMLRMDTLSSAQHTPQATSIVLLTGLQHAQSISSLIRTVTCAHVALSQPMRPATARLLCRLLELLKAIQFSFYRRSMMLIDAFSQVGRHHAYSAMCSLDTARTKLLSSRKTLDANLDVVSALDLAITLLNGPPSRRRLTLINVAMCVVAQQAKHIPGGLESCQQHLRKLGAVSDLIGRLDDACQCWFMYWQRPLLPAYFASVYKHPSRAHKLHYVFAALNDCQLLFQHLAHTDDPRALQTAFHNDVMAMVDQELLSPLCHDIETDLRLQTHSHLQLEDRNPFRVGVTDLGNFLAVKPIRFMGSFISIHDIVSQYLDRTFYNLTTVALHDWKSYAEMRTLAAKLYGLQLAEVHLPSQTLEQGLDVLEIMRKIHVFVGCYSYNLNHQLFIERSSSNKHLNTITIRHIANSIRTHGLGIMNTTVNFTYQFLRKKFFIFSQFLYDDHIKGRLIKDARYFREHKSECNQQYPYERAEKFHKGIRKLGVNQSGETYLDQFRALITQIGNAMGYVRAIRSGGLHYLSNAIQFVPDLEGIVSFADLVEADGLSAETAGAAKNLDAVIDNLSKNFSEGSQYFKMLVEVFSEEFRDPKHMHLRNFHVIVPALTVNFVEHMLAAKERLGKKNATSSMFTDDGFAMGVAYILKLLDQHEQFDSLHWFESVDRRFTQLLAEISQNKARQSKEEAQTSQLTAMRHAAYQKEFELLGYLLSSARIFFRDAGPDPKIEQEKDKQPPQAPTTEQKTTA